MKKAKPTFIVLFIASLLTLPYSATYAKNSQDTEGSASEKGDKVTGGGIKDIEKKAKVGFFTTKR